MSYVNLFKIKVGAIMKISDFVNNIPNVNLYRDGEFDYIDFANSKLASNVFTFIDNEKFIYLLSSSITCIICNNKIASLLPEKYGILVSDTPRLDLFLIHNYLSLNSNLYKRSDTENAIGYNCKISDRASIGDKNIIIGDNVIIEENVIIRENVLIGDNSIIRAGAVVGGEGFQFNKQGETFFINHSGGVYIGKNVELQYNTCIDKALFPWDNTKIGDESKLDNLIHVGHAAKIGSNCLIAANASIGGSTIIGDNCWVGVGATISNNLLIGDNASIKLGAVVTTNIDSDMSVSGNFAIEHNKFINFIKSIR